MTGRWVELEELALAFVVWGDVTVELLDNDVFRWRSDEFCHIRSVTRSPVWLPDGKAETATDDETLNL